MARERNNSVQAKRNRNNKKRGNAFEKKTAEILNMYQVPYSGTNSRFGWNDIRDDENKDKSYWMGECKNITCEDTITIKREWLQKAEERAYMCGCLPFLAFMKAGGWHKIILLNSRVFSLLETMANTEYLIVASIELIKKSHNTVNLIIPYSDIIKEYYNDIIRIKNDGDNEWYYMMNMDTFKIILKQSGYHRQLEGEDD